MDIVDRMSVLLLISAKSAGSNKRAANSLTSLSFPNDLVTSAGHFMMFLMAFSMLSAAADLELSGTVDAKLDNPTYDHMIGRLTTQPGSGRE